MVTDHQIWMLVMYYFTITVIISFMYQRRSSGNNSSKLFGVRSTGTADNDIVILPSGNVGIGDTNPFRKLTVDGTIHVSSSDGKYTTDGWSRYLEFNGRAVSGGGGIIWKKQSSGINESILANQGDMYFGRSTADDNSDKSTYDMFIKRTGEVGIGTTKGKSSCKIIGCQLEN